jgi:cell volume regulation protein A
MVTDNPAGVLPLPAGADILLLVRGKEALPVRDDTVLLAGDHVHVMLRPEHRGTVELLFGLREED